MFKYVWLCMLLCGYGAWGIYSIVDIIKSHKLNVKCEEISSCFLYTTAAAIFIASLVTWFFQFV